MAPQNFALNIDDATYQSALNRAQIEGRTLDAVLVELLTNYAGGEPERMISSYTVQRGDSLSRIAREIYGDATKYPLIQQANNLTDPGRIWVGQVLVIPALGGAAPATPSPVMPQPAPFPPSPPLVRAPVPPSPPVVKGPATPSAPAPLPSSKVPTSAPAPAPAPPEPKIDPCAPIRGEKYGTLPIVGSPTDRPAAKHGDINLSLRGFSKTNATQALINMNGPTDTRAPQLATLFVDERTPKISGVYRANHWEWGSNSRGGVITDFEVTLIGCATESGETIHVPAANYEIGRGFAVLVLYADKERITLKYTGEDSVISGYAIHVDGVCVEPSLLALYEQMNAAGRRELPALRAKQPFGRARGAEIQIAIRDTGRFMDPRVRKDWWRGR